MDIYTASLTVHVLLLLAAGYWKTFQDSKDILVVQSLNEREIELLDDEIHDIDRETTADRYHDFRLQFLSVYGFAVAADWLQGSFMYSVYKHRYELPEPTIAMLFATGFLCGGISATFVGSLADRILGGVSTTLLCTVFEAWMVENRGTQKPVENSPSAPGLATHAKSRTLFALGMTICFLEGSMYIMVYSWSQALTSARDLAFEWARGKPPFGLIFANFMCEGPRFWAFCGFELCLGIYFPAMAYLKGSLVSDAQRAKVYGLMRVPLNALTVMALATIEEGDASRENRFMFYSGMLILSVGVMAAYMPR
ncbi:uncharacterized protein J7T54_004466 [Emericellopsis cladophorae]|uniref:Molybdate-anion transporter n=1 Tax=Emericellopsis cladophorae TaxID=2686198 RepID=A0A9Q0BGK0_9HYPO|nr:uncharacterized protein J7T54_004466 [Emericellopsis cladophorae]KAI6783439.1 hypothetical protein J7T54_004466 [Emericellopsis cladophorae]